MASTIDAKSLSKKFAYAREMERTSVILGEKGSALNQSEYNDALGKLHRVRAHVQDSPYYTSVMSPAIVQPSLRSRGVDLSAAEIRGVLRSDPMKGSAPSLKLMLDTPDLLCFRSGVTIRISEKTIPSGKKIEQAVKLDIGKGNHDRLEFEHAIKNSASDNPAFRWNIMEEEEQEVIRAALDVDNLDDLNLKVWMFLFGSNWQTEYMPDGNTDILLKQKHDRYHIRDVFGWEAYIAKVEIEADQEYINYMLANGRVKPKDHMREVARALDEVHKKQLDSFPDILEAEVNSIYQQRFAEIANDILPQIQQKKKGMKKFAKEMGFRKFKSVSSKLYSPEI